MAQISTQRLLEGKEGDSHYKRRKRISMDAIMAQQKYEFCKVKDLNGLFHFSRFELFACAKGNPVNRHGCLPNRNPGRRIKVGEWSFHPSGGLRSGHPAPRGPIIRPPDADFDHVVEENVREQRIQCLIWRQNVVCGRTECLPQELATLYVTPTPEFNGCSWRPFETYQGRRVCYCTLEEVHDDKKKVFGKFTLAKSLAGLVEDSSSIEERKPKTSMELKRMVELRIKKRVKEQHMNGKFHDLMAKVISNPATLRDAYNSIRISSNVDLEPEGDYLPFESMALELSSGSFNVETNIYSISTRGANKEALVLPNLKLMVVQEAIRIALEVVYKPNFYKSSHGCRSGRSHSSALKRGERESPAVRAVHKLKEKVKLFASQKRVSWDAGTVRIGKKWLGHGLKKVKESEIRHLADQSSTLSQVSRFRKTGMETDHWYKVLLKVWMQTMNVKSAVHEGFLLSKYIVEPALPQELRDSFYTFQKRAEEYVSSETASTLALLSCSHSESPTVTEIIAPVHAIKKRLLRYGLVNAKGNPRACYMLILQDNNQIIDWFSGIVCRWFRWYSLCDNFNEVKLIVSDQVRKSCIRTLAAKYRIHESDIENRFDSELSRLPVMQEIDSSNDEAFMYGISYSGLCLLSLARMASQSRPCSCFVMGCMAAAPCVYTLHVMERQKFPGWKTGFSTSIHPSLHGRRIGLCKKHVKDLYGGRISLQSIDYGAWR
ncbi:hypothetical protein RJ639_003271 [Escallonia herrerae]|uniref:Domain X domain-containing protein n=1 Tax=Escallonia herrerae TaxID=1293975 RepID=A0AA89AUR8_9ASTE|nr:hypothetical protein RJ639_003271 [Escallonia herrerae]